MGIFTDDMHTAAWNKGLATKTKDCNLYEWSVERYNSHSDLKKMLNYNNNTINKTLVIELHVERQCMIKILKHKIMKMVNKIMAL